MGRYFLENFLTFPEGNNPGEAIYILVAMSGLAYASHSYSMNDGLLPVPDDLDLGQTIRGFASGQEVFGRYRLVKILGRGGMGVVWLAHDQELKEEVALKFLPELVRLDEACLEEMRRETRQSRKLAHPHIVKVYDFISDGVSAAISMEYVKGFTLSALRAKKENLHFEVEDIVGWMGQACEALEYAHTKAKLIHRDLKAANLMVTEEGDLKVTDFGISSSISDTMSRVTVVRGTSGTVSYMSPQQAMGKKPTVSDDIYSVGAMIYELLTGKPPFHTGNLVLQLQNVVPPSMAERRGDLDITGEPIPQEWEEAVALCLSKEPETRPQSAKELGDWLSGRAKPLMKNKVPPVVEKEPTPKGRDESDPKPIRAHKPSPLLILFLVLLSVGLASGLVYYYNVVVPQENARLAEIAKEEDLAKQRQAEADAAQAAARQAEADAAQAAADKTRLQAEAAKAAADAEALRTQKEKDAQAAAKAEQDRVAADAEKQKEQQAAQALLESKWPKAGETWTNSLGLKFVPAGTDGILFCVYDVRVEDYQQFVNEEHPDMSGGMYALKVHGSAEKGYTASYDLDPNASWESPGFKQGPDYPVVGVSWNDAEAFCQWLTQKEQKAGELGPNQSYRLPKDQEWSQAVGYGKYPWGDWPPPSGAGNYADDSWKASMPKANWQTIPGDDGYAHTSPVGSFHANAFGLYDMGGNVWQWCEDWYSASMNSDEVKKKVPSLANDNGGGSYNVLRGASWDDFVPVNLLSAYRARASPSNRGDDCGFRLVVVVSP